MKDIMQQKNYIDKTMKSILSNEYKDMNNYTYDVCINYDNPEEIHLVIFNTMNGKQTSLSLLLLFTLNFNREALLSYMEHVPKISPEAVS